tara:strand:- start:3549 stop:4436 length:888 start_codon:yes stop_codon:yes gene_type:complete
MKLIKLIILKSLFYISYCNIIEKVAIITGGTRGIGYGISNSLAKRGYNLLLTYNTNREIALISKKNLENRYNISVVLVGGDLSKKQTRDLIYDIYDNRYGGKYELSAIINNAGQYIGVTSDNCENLNRELLILGDGLEANYNNDKFRRLRYYQKLYGDAYIDMCERGLHRMNNSGSLIGISSPGCNLLYNPQPGYALPGIGKTIMEYSMRLIALESGKKNINCNVLVPGAIKTEAWDNIKNKTGNSGYEMITRMQPMGEILPNDIGEIVGFLCSKEGKYITGLSIPVDSGLHLRA